MSGIVSRLTGGNTNKLGDQEIILEAGMLSVHLFGFDRMYNTSRFTNEYINNSRHLARKYARIFVRGHYLFREANSFPRAKLEENCELRGTDNVQGQISEHIFAPNCDYCLYYPSNLFRNARSFENWGIFSFSSPEPTILLACGRNRELWEKPL